MKLIIDAQTDVGRRREINEDSYGIATDNKLVVLCDGMGGHNAGEVASRTAVDTILESFERLNKDEIEQICPDFKPAPPNENARRLIAAIRLANHRVYSMANQNIDQGGMGTTVVAMYLENNYLITAHAGDSRAYRFRDNKLQQLTIDHTWIGEFVGEDANEISGIKDISKSNVITRAVGIDPTLKIDILIDSVHSGDQYLLCTDGLCGLVPDNDILAILEKSQAPGDSIRQLIALANDRGGPDNITAAIITVAKVEKAITAIERIQTTVKEQPEELPTARQQIVENLSRRQETVKIRLEKPGKKRARLPVVLAALLAAAALIVIVLVLLPRKDQPLKSSTNQAGQQSTKDSAQKQAETPAAAAEQSTTTGMIVFFAIERDHADIIVDDKKISKLGELKEFNKYQLQVRAGTHLIEVRLDGFVIKQKITVRIGDEILINIENELEKLKTAKK